MHAMVPAAPRGDSDTLFSSSKCLGQFSRHGVGVSSYITNLSDKHTSKREKNTEKTHFHACHDVALGPEKKVAGGGRNPTHFCFIPQYFWVNFPDAR